MNLPSTLVGNVNNQYGTRPDLSTLIPGRLEFESTAAQIGALQLRQPLLKNFWVDGTRHQIQVAKNRLKYTEWALRFRIETVISNVEKAYYELIFARENVKVQAKALELAERLLSENKKRVEVGALAPLDEKQAQSQVADARANLLDRGKRRLTAGEYIEGPDFRRFSQMA